MAIYGGPTQLPLDCLESNQSDSTILPLLGSQAKDVAAIEAATGDVLVSVRKAGLSAAQSLLKALPEEPAVAALWVRAALPLIRCGAAAPVLMWCPAPAEGGKGAMAASMRQQSHKPPKRVGPLPPITHVPLTTTPQPPPPT